jgi:hypothetical protein
MKAWWVAIGCALVATAFCWPIVSSGTAFGIDDWDQQLFYAEAARRSIAVYHQLPLWNPWYCGGSPLLANPSSTFFDPWFLSSLALDVVRAGKLGVVAHQWLAMMGAWMLARRLGARGIASLLAPVVFGLTSTYTLHIATGHTIWFAHAYLPWAVFFTVGAVDAASDGDRARALREAVGAGLATALLLFCGNAYFFVYQCLFAFGYAVLCALSSRPWRRAARPLAGGAAVGALTVGFAAIKLVPMIAFLGAVSHYETGDDSGASGSLLWLALVGRDQSLTAQQLPEMHWRWWEFGAYVGLLPLALAVVGAVARRARTWRISALGAFFLLVAMGNGGPAWPLLRDLPGFSGLRVPSRAIVFFVLAVACLASIGGCWLVERARQRFRPRLVGAVAALAVVAVLIDFFAVTRAPLAEAFVLPPVDLAEAPRDAPFEQSRGQLHFVTRSRYSDYLDRTPRNVGMVTCYDRLHLPVAARAPFRSAGVLDPDYHGEAWLDGGSGAPTLTFSPNRLVVDVAASGGTLVINQNADDNWRATVRGQPATLVAHAGLLAVALPADGAPARVELRYAPSSTGTWLTLSTLLGAVVVFVRRKRQSAPGSPAVAAGSST